MGGENPGAGVPRAGCGDDCGARQRVVRGVARQEGAARQGRANVGSSMLLTDRSSWRDRVLGALRLDAETYAEIAADDAATWQAFAVLAVSIVVALIPGAPDVGRIIGAGGPADQLVW